MAGLANSKSLGLIGILKKEKMERNVKRLLEEMPKTTRDKVYSYWHSLDLNSKKEFLRVNVDDFTSHFEMPETPDCEMGAFVRQVRVRVRYKKHWITWVCVHCEDNAKEFDDPRSHRNHLVFEHVQNLMSTNELLQRLWPRSDERQCIEMIEMIHRCSWKPVDISAAIEMLENRAKSKGHSVSKAVQDWPLSDDFNRADILKRIRDKFHLLIQHNFFAPSHLTHVINLANNEIFGLAGSQILSHALDQSLDCICFLEAPELKKVLKFMLEVSHAYGLVLNLNGSTDPSHDLPDLIQVPTDFEKQIRLSEDASCFLLDGCLVSTTGSTTEGAIMKDVITNIDSFLPWIFSGSCLGEWERWSYEKNIKINRAFVHVQNLQNLSGLLKESLEEKCRLANYDKALKVVEDLCREEVENENFNEYILRERKEELTNNVKHIRDTFELDVITNVLEEAHKLKVKEFDYDKSYLKMAIEKMKLIQSEKLVKIGVIIKSNVDIKRSIIELHNIACFDYQLGFLPLVKAYLKARLVASFERDAKMKSDAAGDALLSELDVESNKDIKRRSDNAKQSKKKTKNKRSTKRNRKMNKLKATYDTELVLADLAVELEETTIHMDEQHGVDTIMIDHYPVSHDEKSPYEVRLEEIEAQRKKFAEAKKEIEAAKKLIEEMTSELEVKKNLHAQELTELRKEDKDEEMIKNALKNHAERGNELEAEGKFIQDLGTELSERISALLNIDQLAIDEERIKSQLFWSKLKI